MKIAVPRVPNWKLILTGVKNMAKLYLLRREIDVRYATSLILYTHKSEGAWERREKWKRSHFDSMDEACASMCPCCWQRIYWMKRMSSSMLICIITLSKWNSEWYNTEIRFIGCWKFNSFLSPRQTYFSPNTFCSRRIVRPVPRDPELLPNSWFQGDHSKRAIQILRCLIDCSLPLNDVDCYCSAFPNSSDCWCVVGTCDAVNDVNFCK